MRALVTGGRPLQAETAVMLEWQHGMVDLVRNVREALQRAEADIHDVVVMESGISCQHGLALLRELRKLHKRDFGLLVNARIHLIHDASDAVNEWPFAD